MTADMEVLKQKIDRVRARLEAKYRKSNWRVTPEVLHLSQVLDVMLTRYVTRLKEGVNDSRARTATGPPKVS